MINILAEKLNEVDTSKLDDYRVIKKFKTVKIGEREVVIYVKEEDKKMTEKLYICGGDEDVTIDNER